MRGTHTYTRRKLVTAVAATGAAGLIHTQVTGPAFERLTEGSIPTPVAKKFQAWQAAQWEANNAPSLTDEEIGALCDYANRLADEVLDLPSQEPMDFIRKLIAQSFYGEHEIGNCPRGEELWAEARAMIDGRMK